MTKNSNLEIVGKVGETPYVVYTESSSKNNSGGLKNRKIAPKQVYQFANVTNPKRCFIRLLKMYRKHRPQNGIDDFYLTPLPNPKGAVWYKNCPIGVNTVPLCKICVKRQVSKVIKPITP